MCVFFSSLKGNAKKKHILSKNHGFHGFHGFLKY
jgi:adenosylmethionine-8-amino-7-oxononanoate aminotransferase